MTSVENQQKDRNKKAVIAAERLVVRAQSEFAAERFVQSFDSYQKAIELAEPTLGQRCGIGMARLATLYETCGHVALRHHFVDGERDTKLHDAALTCLRKAVNYFAQCVGNLKYERSLDNAWSQVFRLHNLALHLLERGFYFEAEHHGRRLIALFDEMIDQGFPLNRFVWLRARYVLARSLIGQNLTEAAHDCITVALAAPACTEGSTGALETRAELEKLLASMTH